MSIFRRNAFRTLIKSLSSPTIRSYIERNPTMLRSVVEHVSKLARIPQGTMEKTVHFEGLMARWTTPKTPDGEGVVLYLHGGAFVFGSHNTHRSIVALLAKASGLRVLCVDYRLAPEHPFPAALDDCERAYKWLLEEQGVAPTQVVIAGDSAGGGLAVSTLLRLRDRGLPLPAAACCMSPWLDLEGTGENSEELEKTDPIVYMSGLRKFGLLYAQTERNLRHPYVSPVHAACHGLPPLLIQVSSSEVLRDDTTRFARAATAAGVDVQVQTYQDMIHVWQMLGPALPEARDAYEKMGIFIRQKLRAANQTVH